MPAGYSTRCKVCNHPRRAEIERWHFEEGASYREIERRLEGATSFVAIGRHFREHCNVQEEAAVRYRAAQERFDEQVEKRLTDLERLDDSIDRAHRLSKAAGETIEQLVRNGGKLPKTLVDLYAAASAELRQTKKTKMEALGEDPEGKKAEAVQSLVDLLLAAGEEA
ncbi:MAG: hypothetical protein ACM3XZ_02815 [Betaproteobacteria bacterium]